MPKPTPQRRDPHRLTTATGTRDVLRCLDEIWNDQHHRIHHALGKDVAPIFIRDGMGPLPQDRKVDPRIFTSVSEVFMHSLWGRSGSTVYDVHPELFGSIVSGRADYLRLPARVLDNLPHPSPMFLLPQPVRVPLSDGQFGRLAALYVTGMAHGYPVPTNDPGRENLSVMAVIGVETFGGAPNATDFSLLTLSTPQDATIRDAAERTARRYYTRTQQVPGTDNAQCSRDHVMAVTSIAASLITYAGAVNADVERRVGPKKGTPAPGNPTGKSPVRMMSMGYRFGPQIGAARREYEQRAASGQGGDGTKAPHVRVAHPHLYWTGPKDQPQTPIVHVLDPINVKSGIGDLPVVHRVADRTGRK